MTYNSEIAGSPQDLVTIALKRAADKTSPALLKLLEVHLLENTGEGLDLIYKDPDKFIRSVKDLFGEYGGRFFEIAILNELKNLVSYIKSNDLKSALMEIGVL